MNRIFGILAVENTPKTLDEDVQRHLTGPVSDLTGRKVLNDTFY
jgi:hypothetical protein